MQGSASRYKVPVEWGLKEMTGSDTVIEEEGWKGSMAEVRSVGVLVKGM